MAGASKAGSAEEADALDAKHAAEIVGQMQACPARGRAGGIDLSAGGR